MKEALEKVSCVENNERHLNEHNEEESGNVLSDDNYEYYDKDEYLDKDKPKLNKAKILTDVPLETLPCPKELMQSVEDAYGQPIQNEIRLKASSIVKSVSKFIYILTLVLFI